MEKIAVSVIIPIYNVEKYLAECLESALSQDLQNVEFICVNDGSTDKSLEILNTYAEKDNRIAVINQENQGLSCARNTGINHARGEYIFFLDSDDCLVKGALEKLYIEARNMELEILTFDAECFYETEELKRREFKDNYYRKKKEYPGVWEGEELFCEFMENDDFCDGACVLFIKRIWMEKEEIRFMPGILHEDCLFSFECYTKVQRIAYKKQKYLRYRIREASIMTSKPSYSSLIGRLICYKEILRFLMTHKPSFRLEAAVSKYAEFIMYNIKYMDFALKDEQKNLMDELPTMDKLLADSLGIGKTGRYTMNTPLYKLGFQTLIQCYDEILLYGAGKIGRIVWNYLKRNGMEKKVIGFAVSGNPADDEKIENMCVKSIKEYEASNEILVLITARWDYQDAMIRNAKRMGFQKIEVIDFRLEQLL